MITTEEDLIRRTEEAIDLSTKERETSQQVFEKNAAELDDAIDAVKECMALLRGL